MEIKNSLLLKQLKLNGLNYTNDLFSIYFVEIKVKQHFIDIIFAELYEGECNGIVMYEVAVYETRGFMFKNINEAHIVNLEDLLDQWLDYNPSQKNELLFSNYFYKKSDAIAFAENDLNAKKSFKECANQSGVTL